MTLTIELSPEVEAKLQAGATRQGLSLPEYALKKLLTSVEETKETTSDYLLHLQQKFQNAIPEEERAKTRVDGSINHDHYLYGAPKVQE